MITSRLIPHRAWLLAGLCLLLKLQPECRAASIYTIGINTTAFTGQNGTLAFDFIDGDGQSANNTVNVTSLGTDGTLANPANVSLTDTGFFNEELRAITFGTYLSFTLQLTENNVPLGFDQFSLFFLDSVSFLPLLSTTDPTGASALFAIDITGASGGTASVFDPVTGGPAWDVTPVPTQGVPDQASTFSLLALSIFSAGLVRLAQFRRPASR